MAARPPVAALEPARAPGAVYMAAGAPGRGSRRSGGPRRPQTALGALWRVLAALAVGLLVAGCYGGEGIGAGDNVRYYHDDEHKVGCWTAYDRSITCLPDREYLP